MTCVAGLKKNRTEAREPAPIKPVADDVIEATLPHMQPIPAAMVQLRRLTGARPAEICSMRPCDVDRSTDVWAYRPHSHKTEYAGRERIIFIGPKAQAILRPFLLRDANAYCFSPAESEDKHNAQRKAERKSKMTPSQARRRRKQRPMRSRMTATA